jgi:hypothetical protein
MNPLSSIPPFLFYSYRSAEGFFYGFHLMSLFRLFQCTQRFQNPYTREEFLPTEIYKMYEVYCKFRAISPPADKRLDYFIMHDVLKKSCSHRPPLQHERTEEHTEPVQWTESNTRHMDALTILFQKTGQLTLQERTEQLFAEILELTGMPRDPALFFNLRKPDYENFYLCAFFWWSRLEEEEQNRLCGLENPFPDVAAVRNTHHAEMEYRLLCLEFMEKIVYTGLNREDKIQGAKEMLAVLNMVVPRQG